MWQLLINVGLLVALFFAFRYLSKRKSRYYYTIREDIAESTRIREMDKRKKIYPRILKHRTVQRRIIQFKRRKHGGSINKV